MRRTDLKRTTTAIVLTVACIVVLLGAYRSMVRAPDEKAEEGAGLFREAGCIQCHHTDSRETKFGPGLEGLFERETLPVSGRPVTEENLIRQMEDPYGSMPSFEEELSREEMRLIVDHLETL
jgi:mono/diheme cytochrome c family protein